MKSPFELDPEQLNKLLELGAEATQPSSRAKSDAPEDSGPPEATTQRLGAWIDRYKLVSLLGEGGMAFVYLAHQEYPIQRQVALKLIKPGMDSTRLIARFEAERQALTLLHHPNIAQILDAGTTEEGRPYFVMEYVEGQSITAYCDRHRLRINERLGLFRQACEGIHHAHQRGIIHRDIKPSNVLVAIQDDQAVPKIIDFGVARATRHQFAEQTLLTEDGHLVGTPEYMSPEQANLGSEGIDVRADVYSLGVLLYVLLTGALPFDAKELREGGIETARRIICEEDPKTPSTRLMGLGQEAAEIAENRSTAVQSLANRLRRELEWIPLKAMRKEREERYQSASELADDIRSYVERGPLLAGPPSPVYRAKKFVRRHKTVVVGTLAVLVVSLIGTIVSFVFALGQARARAEAQAVSDFLRHSVLESLDPFKVGGREISSRSVVDAASKSLEQGFTGTALAEAEIRYTVGNAYWSLGLYEQAESHLRRALDIQQAQLGPEDPATLACAHYLGWVYFLQCRYGEAEQLLVQTQAGKRRALGEEHGETLLSSIGLALVYNSQGRFHEAEKLLDETLETAHRVLGEGHPYVPGAMNALACCYERQGRYSEAEQMARQGLGLARRVLGDNDFVVLLLKDTLGRTLLVLGHYQEAEQAFQEVLKGRREAWGEEHPDTLGTMISLAWLYYSQGRYERAESMFVKTIESARRLLGDAHLWSLSSMHGLGTVYLSQGRYDEAVPLLEGAFETARHLLGEKDWATLRVANTLARLYRAQGHPDEAEELFAEALAARRHDLGDEHLDTLETINDLGVLRREQQRYNEAESLLRQALEGRQRKLSPDHPGTLESMHELAVLYIVQARYKDAEPLLLEAFRGRETKLGPEHPPTIESLNQLVILFDAWPKPDEAAKWRARLAQGYGAKE